MASLNQLVSQVAIKYGKTFDHGLRESTRSLILQLRNQEIRRSYTGNGLIDQVFKQSFIVECIEVSFDEFDFKEKSVRDVYGGKRIHLRTRNRVPRPIRFTNNIPFTTIRCPGYKSLPLMYAPDYMVSTYSTNKDFRNKMYYTYKNNLIYFYNVGEKYLDFHSNESSHPVWIPDEEKETPIEGEKIYYMLIEAPFEKPHLIDVNDNLDYEYFDDNEYLIPEDMIPAILNQIYANYNLGGANDKYIIHKEGQPE